MSDSQGGRVLVVDDDEAIRALIRVNLELEGFRVVTARDGAECLELVHRVAPDVITLDSAMPRLGGLRTAERLRADPRTAGIPLALVSASAGDQEDAGAYASAAALVDGFLDKPFEPAALVRLVRELVARRAPAAPPPVIAPVPVIGATQTVGPVRAVRSRPRPGGGGAARGAPPMPDGGLFSPTLAP